MSFSYVIPTAMATGRNMQTWRKNTATYRFQKRYKFLWDFLFYFFFKGTEMRSTDRNKQIINRVQCSPLGSYSGVFLLIWFINKKEERKKHYIIRRKNNTFFLDDFIQFEGKLHRESNIITVCSVVSLHPNMPLYHACCRCLTETPSCNNFPGCDINELLR